MRKLAELEKKFAVMKKDGAAAKQLEQNLDPDISRDAASDIQEAIAKKREEINGAKAEFEMMRCEYRNGKERLRGIQQQYGFADIPKMAKTPELEVCLSMSESNTSGFFQPADADLPPNPPYPRNREKREPVLQI